MRRTISDAELTTPRERIDASNDPDRLLEAFAGLLRGAATATGTEDVMADVSAIISDGEVYGTDREWVEWAPCGCQDGRHEFGKGSYWGRGWWRDDEKSAREAAAQMSAVAPGAKVRPHVVRHVHAETAVEVAP
ncbi:hypothetical protein [Antribacter gilvus]|uniref:hypothetical protein n=1 Tax=Antribacter gilvus TaxID=2304675 RepID=UPI000F774841|nr:hypothetical protein [Antribacter gilvus]